jgi:phosphate starvation-inducible PhoH-like protein
MDVTIQLEEPHKRASLFGAADRHLRLVRRTFGVRVSARDSLIHVSGASDEVARATDMIRRMQEMLRSGDHLTERQVDAAMAEAAAGLRDQADADQIDVFARDRTIVPKTEGQKEYVRAMRRDDLVFCTGPAGTGKTYLAVAMAASLMKQGVISRMVLVRPAVEAGEKLGYLPGDMQAKVNPYLRPLFDALYDMAGYDQIRRMMENDIIEVVPLAFMRGRTLNHSIIILDEAQNTTISQMLMFLTRLGQSSKMIVTGDDSQIDLQDSVSSGLLDAVWKLKGIKGVSIVRLRESDIVRHRLVQNIVAAYARARQPEDSGVRP